MLITLGSLCGGLGIQLPKYFVCCQYCVQTLTILLLNLGLNVLSTKCSWSIGYVNIIGDAEEQDRECRDGGRWALRQTHARTGRPCNAEAGPPLVWVTVSGSG